MAIDPSISLGIRPQQMAPLQIQSPLDRYQKMLTLRHLMQQGQLGEQRLQAGALELEEQQRAQRDQEMMRSAYMQSGGDLDVFEQLASKSGVSPKSVIGIRSERLKLQLEIAKIKNEELPGRKYRNEQLSGITQGALALPPDQYSQQWPTLRAAAHAVDPKLGLPLDPIPQDQLQLYGLAFATETGLINRLEETRKQAAEKRAVATHEAELPEKQAKSLREEMATAGQTAPDNQAEWDVWRAGFSKRAQGFIPAMFSPAGLQAVQKIAVPLKAATPGVDVELSPPVFAQKKELAIAGAPIAGRDIPKPQSVIDQEIETERILSTIRAQARDAKEPTQPQYLVAGFASRLVQAEPTLKSVLEGRLEQTWNRLPIAEWMRTDIGKEFAQAERNWINANLRRESGAVISDQEFANARAQYVPQPGDSPARLEQKRRNRLVVQQNYIRAAGRAYADPEDLLRDAGALPSAPLDSGGGAGGGKIAVPLKSGATALFDTQAQADRFKREHPDRVK